MEEQVNTDISQKVSENSMKNNPTQPNEGISNQQCYQWLSSCSPEVVAAVEQETIDLARQTETFVNNYEQPLSFASIKTIPTDEIDSIINNPHATTDMLHGEIKKLKLQLVGMMTRCQFLLDFIALEQKNTETYKNLYKDALDQLQNKR